jgi:hypothetical protein
MEVLMDPRDFDRHTRRFVLAGLGGGALAAFLGGDATAARRPSKRKRCRKKKRTFCDDRCCPKQHRCEQETCVRTCDDPCPPGQPGGSCEGDEPCFCATSISGKTARLKTPANHYCLAGTMCSPSNLCPPGQICGTCSCGASACSYRCYDPCPPG